VQFECKVIKVEALGQEGGAGNLIFSEVVKIHIHKDILDEKGTIDQHKIDQVARMGGNWYSRANLGMFEVPKPLSTLGIGVDQIPLEIRNSEVLSGNDLGQLGNVEGLPTPEEVQAFFKENASLYSLLRSADTLIIHRKAKEFLEKNDADSAWKILMVNN
jgi:hypothetical protein